MSRPIGKRTFHCSREDGWFRRRGKRKEKTVALVKFRKADRGGSLVFKNKSAEMSE
jgi:hypothetical protein